MACGPSSEMTKIMKIISLMNFLKLEKVSIGHGCPRQMPFRKRVYRINAMHALIKFPEYIPYGLGVMARTRSGTYGRTDVRDGQG